MMKNFWSIVLYNFKLRKWLMWSIVLNMILLIYAIVDFYWSIANNTFEMLLLLFTINVLWQMVTTYIEIRHMTEKTGHFLQSNTVTEKFMLSSKLSEDYEEYYDVEANIAVIVNNKIDKVLRGDVPIKMRYIDYHNRKVDNYIKQNREILMLFLKTKWHSMDGGSFYNDQKLCMSSEIYRKEGCFNVVLDKGCYYNSYLTNEIYNIKLSHQSAIEVYPPLSSKLYPIKSLGDSMFGNHIGVSTIAISSDGYAILLKHNNRTAVGANKLQSTGSGSADWTDWDLQLTDFRQCIMRVAERELREETGLKVECIQSTQVIGFYRSLYRGGKPEFCCVTHLVGDRYDICHMLLPEEAECVNYPVEVQVEIDGKFDDRYINKLLEEERKNISNSLYMNIYYLKKYFC